MEPRVRLTGGAALCAAAAFGALALASGCSPKVAEVATAACDVASLQAAAPKDTTIVKAELVTDPVANCRVDGYVTTNDPTPNKNNFRLQLPAKEDWQKRYFFIGMGGAAGYVPTDSQIPGGNPVTKGFAVAGTDTGHTGHILDWSALGDPAMAEDHVHRGAHVVAQATQQLTKAYYGGEKFYRYHSGCSGGGRMGMEVLTRHPEDFDGVLLGWPGGRWPEGRPAPPSHGQAFEVMIAEMVREPGSWLSPAKLQLAEDKVTAACDMTDGAKDEMIWDRRLCTFDFDSLKCPGADAPTCLTQPEITSIENLLRKTDMPISNMTEWSSFLGPVPPPWDPAPTNENMPKTSAALVIHTTWVRTLLNQPDRDLVKNPLSAAEMKQLDDARIKVAYGMPTPAASLAPAQKAGTKALFFAGMSDPCCSYVANENFINDLGGALGGAQKVADFAVIYPVAGSGHCGGGTGPDDHVDVLLTELVNWVEKGEKPGGVVAGRGEQAKPLFSASGDFERESGVKIPGAKGRSRQFLLCPYPTVAVFDTSKAGTAGAVYEAANWSCKASRS